MYMFVCVSLVYSYDMRTHLTNKRTYTHRMSEVRLKDFKAVFDRHGSYRFYFKTQDPDCGVVREEVSVRREEVSVRREEVTVWSSEGGECVEQ